MPSLAHGAINGFAAVPLLFLNPDYLDKLTVGPAPIGIIGMLPMLIWAVWMLIKDNSEGKGIHGGLN